VGLRVDLDYVEKRTILASVGNGTPVPVALVTLLTELSRLSSLCQCILLKSYALYAFICHSLGA
jgi:hypothetical protein